MNFIQSLTFQLHADSILMPPDAVARLVQAAVSEADDLDDLRDMLDFTRCGSCGQEIQPADDAEVCWWCQGDLCVDCWEEHGHCGHPEAEEMNERMRAWYKEHG